MAGRNWMIAGVLATVLLAGCGSASSVRVRSVESAVEDVPVLPTVVYTSPDQSGADIFLTDLSSAQLDPGVDLSEASGRIVVLNLFVVPLGGSTPMANSACSVAVRHIVLARGSIGVYSGGGFLNPSRAGGTDIAGSIQGATLRLTQKTPSFADKLGPARMDATFTASRDDALARRIRSRVNEILAMAGKVEPKEEQK